MNELIIFLNLFSGLYLIYLAIVDKCNPPMSLGILFLGLGLIATSISGIEILKFLPLSFHNEYIFKHISGWFIVMGLLARHILNQRDYHGTK